MTTVLIVDDVRPMADQYAYDLRRLANFETLTRQAPLPRQVRESEPLYEAAVTLLRRTLVEGRATNNP